ncbi:hypothetical protein G7Y79_00033g067920 [Physcia stellaris]|nr:hypothetical protein G7Y79_00033g067920 [Physcia stellaris]
MPNLAPGPTPYVDLTASSPPRPVKTVLHDAISTAPESRIRLALRNACDISGEVSRVVQEMLLVPEEKVKYRIVEKDLDSEGDVDEDESDEGKDDEDEDEDTENNEDEDTGEQTNGVSVPSLKRLRPRYAFCVNCEDEFDVETNEKNSCKWHPGILPLIP